MDNFSNYFVPPLQLRDYLKHSGWQLAPNLEDDYVLRHPEARREIRFPVDDSAPNYREALEFAYLKLTSLLRRSEREIYQEILSVASDMVLLRFGTMGNRPSIGFETALRSVAALERLLRASSSTVRKPQTSHKRMSFSETTMILERSRFEQTAIGSFVLRVSCPVDALDNDGPQATLGSAADDGDKRTFVRRVFENIHEATAGVVRAIVSDQVEELAERVLQSEQPQVSANFCDGLAQVAEVSEEPTYMDFSWSPRIRREGTKPIRISSEYSARLETLATLLKEEGTDEVEVFIGTVERLDGQIGRDGRRAGEAILALFQADDVSTVIRARVDLTAEQYQTADRAHMAGNAYVRVEGRLAPGRQPRRLAVLDFKKVT